MKQALSRVWVPVDRVVEWVQNGIDTVAQQRVAMLTILVSIPVMIIGPLFTTDPTDLFIYEMSAFALTLTGVTWLAGLQAKRASEEHGSNGDDQTPPPPVP